MEKTRNPESKQWQKVGGIYAECGPSFGTLPSGAYRFYKDWEKGVCAEPVPIKTENLIKFKGGKVEYLLNELDRFWSSKDEYDKLGIAWKRGILMSGSPGNGKSGLIQMVSRGVIEKGGIVAMVSNPQDFIATMPYIYKVQYDAPMVVVLEDIEGLLGQFEPQILEILDGSSDSKPGTVYIATTNHLDGLPARIKDRPSRFDTVVEIPKPTEDMLYEYIGSFIKDNPKTVEELVSRSLGLSIAHVKELVIATVIYGYSIDQTLDRLKRVKDDPDPINSDLEVKDVPDLPLVSS
jgi:hypothetical protein